MPGKSPKKLHPDHAKRHVKLSFRRHLIPPLGGLLVTALVFGFFNSQFLSGYITYRIKQHNAPQTVQVEAIPAETPPQPDPTAPSKIAIGKISIEAPVIYDQSVVNEANFQKALQHGVVHYPGTGLPGQPGNIVLFGHSSGQWWAPGDYKFIFSLLNKVEIGDQITLDYQGIHYIYTVTGTRVVLPDNLAVLSQTGGHKLTLLTCTPVGTNTKRLVVEATQTYPAVKPIIDPTIKPVDTHVQKNLPSAAPSFWHSLKERLHIN